MGFTYLLIFMLAVFFGAYALMLGIIRYMTTQKKFKDYHLDFPVGLGIILPIVLALPFLDFFNVDPFLFAGISAAALTVFLLTAVEKLKRRHQVWAVFVIAFLTSYLLPTHLPVFGYGIAVNFYIHILMAAGVTGFAYLFRWLDRVPFVSLATSLAFATLTVLFADVMGILPVAFGIYALIIIAAQMAVSLCLKPFVVFKLGIHAATAIGFLWGFTGLCLVAQGYVFAPLFASGYYLMELGYALVMTAVIHKTFGVKVLPVIEKALHTNLYLPRIFRIVMFYTIALGLLGFWNDQNGSYLFWIAALMFIAYMLYQFNDWTEKPTYKAIFGELKQGYSELKQNIVAAHARPTETVAEVAAPVKQAIKKIMKPTAIKMTIKTTPKKRKAPKSKKKSVSTKAVVGKKTTKKNKKK